ncbi:MAG: DUF2236 domain-containing protein [Microbacteriaceae bacterium]|nr:DUF2236 domain-containing protein [Microbacteriaceae bacterium]
MRTDGPFRRVAAECAVLAGGGTAILLQLADPRVAAGIARHSDFAAAPMRRLWGTLDYVAAEALGGPVERAHVERLVNARHRAVRGTTASGLRYDANDGDAQRWVAMTLCWSAVRAHRRVFGRAATSGAAADAVVRGFGRLASALGTDPAGWPTTAAAFDARWRTALARLEVGDDARRARDELFAARRAAPWLRAAMPLATRLAVSLLPPEVAAAYGLERGRARRFADALLWAPIVVGMRLAPRPLRTLPARLVLARVRRAARRD